ncbi:nucleoporin p58/p45-like isoform X2 [Leptopilina boulardi]|uniref:nucleoporin p58/p45-like isoform X2 n=1 Tax=Leptopilina boulardi TaxID=63433 RepID=UPI0021F5A925|nr:nucleoporin p58/p45-like isoform X2 [Leptopilina boulardi]
MSKFSFGSPAIPTQPSNTSIGISGQQKTTSTPLAVPFGSTTPSTTGFGTGQNWAENPTTTGLNFAFGSSQPTLTQTSNSNTVTGTTTLNLLQNPTTSAQPSGITFGTSTVASNMTFGAPANTVTSTFGTTPTTGLTSFGVPTTTTALSFGTSTGNTSTLFGSNFGTNFNTAKTTPVTTTAVTSTNKGLGGLDVSVNNKGLSLGSSSPTAVKENLLPKELMQTIDGFKEFVKTQKVLSSDIARGSSRPLNRCAEDTVSLVDLLTTLAGSVQRDRSSADKLKQDTAKALQNAEIAQRTHDTPPGLQYENNAPYLFFIELAENFEHDLLLFKSQIEITEKHIRTMMTPKTLTPQELTMAMGKLHESLVAVAGRLQGVHTKVQQQKEQYLNFRKYVLKDSSNVFEDIKLVSKVNKNNIVKMTSGPTPFAPGYKSFLSSSGINLCQSSSGGTINPLVKQSCQ